MKLPPAAMKASSTAADWAGSVVQPNTLPPKQSTLTSRSVRPSLRLSIGEGPPENVGRADRNRPRNAHDYPAGTPRRDCLTRSPGTIDCASARPLEYGAPAG